MELFTDPVALNGAQVTALRDIVLAVASGELPRSTATALILAAFPLTREEVDRILAGVIAAPAAAPTEGNE